MNVARLYRRFAVVAICLLVVGLVPAHVRAASTIYVSQSAPGGGSCLSPDYNDIQSAVDNAASGDTIHICAGTYNVSAGGLDTSTKSLALVGDGAASTILDAMHNDRILVTDSDISIDGLTFTGGSFGGGSGGAIWDGGGSSVTVTVNHSTFTNNSAASGYGGAIYSSGAALTVLNSTFSNNDAGEGGAVASQGAMQIANTTFSGNAATSVGGAVRALGGGSGSIAIMSSTFAGNSAFDGDSLYSSSVLPIFLVSDIFSSTGTNCTSGVAPTAMASWSTDTSCGSNVTTSANLLLQPLADNGGPTQTIGLGLGSVALGAGLNCASYPVSGVDQRGYPRPIASTCDAGAYEAQPSTLAISPSTADIKAGTTQAYTATAYDPWGNYLGDVTSDVTFSIDKTGACTGTACGSDDFGSYTVTATANGGTGVTDTATLNVGASKLVITGGQTTPKAGTQHPYTVEARDVNNHRVTTYSGSTDVTVTSSDGTATVESPIQLTAGIGTSNITFRDLGAQTVSATDGTLTSAAYNVTVGVGDIDHFVVSVSGPKTAGTPFSFTATAKDALGNTITSYTGTPTITTNFSANIAHPPVAGTFPAFVNGTATSNGNTVDYTAETGRTVTVTDGPISGTSGAFVVNAAAIDHFTIDTVADQDAGTSFSVTATARDAYGNTAASYVGTPTLSNNFSANLAHPRVNGTFTAFVAGHGTGTGITDYTAETSRTVTVTDGVHSGTSNAFDVLVGAVHHFEIATVSSQTAGVPFTVNATAVDQYGNTVTSYTGKPTLTSTLGAAGGHTVVEGSFDNFVAGVGTSDGTTVGYLAQTLRTVTVTDGLLTGTSNPFTLNPGPLDHFAIATITSRTAGAAFGVTATAQDQYDNTVTSYAGTPTLGNNFSATRGTPVAGTFAAFSSGVGTSTGTIDYTAETGRTITVTDGLVQTTSNAFDVAPGALDHFAVNSIGFQRAGIAFGVTAVAKDQWNNTVTSYTGTPVLTNNFSSTRGAPVAGTFTAFVAGQGSATGVKDFTAEGGRTVTVTDSATHKAGTSPAFSVTPAPISKLAISGPTTAVIGVAQTFTVRATDAFGNATTTYTGTVVISSSDTGFVSTPASKALVAGTGTFSIKFNSLRAQTLGARDTVVASIAAAPFTVTVSSSAAGSTYRVIDPIRVLDTRGPAPIGWTKGKLVANTPITFTVVGGSIPAGASAVTGNLTVVTPSSGWAIYIGPTPIAAPKASTINMKAGETAFNGVTVALSATGTLSATYMGPAGAKTDLLFDVTGYFKNDTLGATFHPLNVPYRSLDTRSRIGGLGKFTSFVPQSWKVAGVGTVPANATAVTGNLTVLNPSSGYAIYLGPTPQTKPKTSTVNFNAREIKGNNVTVGLASGKLSATYMALAGNSTDVLFDITGYYTKDLTGAKFVPINPLRVLDTRTPTAKPILYGAPRNFAVAGVSVPGQAPVPMGAVAVTANVTVTGETSGWAVYVGPAKDLAPKSWSINFLYPDTHSNQLTVPLSGDGKGTLWATYMSMSGQSTHLVFDVAGYFIP